MERSRRTALARALRHQPTVAEMHLWRYLRNRQIAGSKWRRQESVGRYFADFACRESMLVIELDGGQHYELDGAIVASDIERSAYIEAQGWRILRFTNRDVLTDTTLVLDEIVRGLEGG